MLILIWVPWRLVARMRVGRSWLGITSSTRVWYWRRRIVGSECQSVRCMAVHNKSGFKWFPTGYNRRMYPQPWHVLFALDTKSPSVDTCTAALSVYQLATKPADTPNRDAFLSMLSVTRSPWTLRVLSEHPQKSTTLSHLTLLL